MNGNIVLCPSLSNTIVIVDFFNDSFIVQEVILRVVEKAVFAKKAHFKRIFRLYFFRRNSETCQLNTLKLQKNLNKNEWEFHLRKPISTTDH